MNYSITFLCKVFKVMRSSYYDWLTRESKPKDKNLKLVTEIKSIFEQSRKTYGVIRVTKDLKENGYHINKKKVARIMKENGLKSVHKAKFNPQTTDSKHNYKVADNVIHQDFTTTGPNQKWGTDITYVRTEEGWLYLAIVLDFYSRKVVGWAFSDSLKTDLCSRALKMALIRRGFPQEIIHHSDRGVQYASTEYSKILKDNNLIQSMSRKGNCYDNAITESWFHTYKVECVKQNQYQTKKQARIDGIDYIENFYNIKRRHSSLDYLSPVEYEECRLRA